ncbi:TraR/DksA C4-type zinc finger protein [Clostridium manihotivorum]|uniref:Molecular chaperone DnaK n=1 Tax=Clostridium manihotivorum TaxID=2320868 RepID=A0A410DSR8_9CLOT|nr:TraR/DksA C4-type zinc finger protein [Clostridium manihotivorum]QAA32042.1 molecular chaperone DnaK [Clostridium manihotivorum]
MDGRDLDRYRIKLNSEKERVLSLIKQLKENEAVDSYAEIASELSFYDNHPADLTTETFDFERGKALKGNEKEILRKIDDGIKAIDEGKYGVCKRCGGEISKERLDFLPYAEYCIKCQNVIGSIKEYRSNRRPVEESVIGNPFGYGYNDFNEYEKVGFDAEDSFQSVDYFNRINNVFDNYDDDDMYVDPVEKISNEQYKSQLPD